MNLNKRLLIYTGKGGVGKTSLSLSACKYLQAKNKKVLLIYFKGNIEESNNPAPEEFVAEQAKQLGIKAQGLELQTTVREYVGKKMKSDTIGKWVVRAPFFKALFNMIPGFSYLIYLGKILEMLKADPELTIVLDSPSSGHALTMLEATHNFSEIFSSGLLFDDAQKMIKTMFQENFLHVYIVTIPTLMAVNEAIELRNSVEKIAKIKTSIICNNCFHLLQGLEKIKSPPFLSEKISNEGQVLDKLGGNITSFIPHIPSLDLNAVIDGIVPALDKLA